MKGTTVAAMLLFLGILYVLSLMNAVPAHSQTSGAAFLNVDPSPRSYALGSADSIADPGAQAMDRNPSLVGLMMTKYEVFGAYQKLISDAQYEHFAFAAQPYSLNPYIDAIGIAVTRLDISNIPGADASGNATGSSFSAGNTAIAIGASTLLQPNLRFGADAKGVQSQIASYKSNWALAADLGLTWTPMLSFMERPLTLALAGNNFGQGQKFLSQTDRLPAAVKIGAAVPILNLSNAFFQVTDLVYDHITSASAGMEYTYKIVSLRIGYNYQFHSPSNLALEDGSSFTNKALSGLTGGIGIHYGALTLDYAISQQAVDYGATQRVALTIAWGEKGEYDEIRQIRPDEESRRTEYRTQEIRKTEEIRPESSRTQEAPAPAIRQQPRAEDSGILPWIQ